MSDLLVCTKCGRSWYGNLHRTSDWECSCDNYSDTAGTYFAFELNKEKKAELNEKRAARNESPLL